jgi:hypothetical protein
MEQLRSICFQPVAGLYGDFKMTKSVFLRINLNGGLFITTPTTDLALTRTYRVDNVPVDINDLDVLDKLSRCSIWPVADPKFNNAWIVDWCEIAHAETGTIIRTGNNF